MNFVPADAIRVLLALSEAFTQPGVCLLAEPCNCCVSLASKDASAAWQLVETKAIRIRVLANAASLGCFLCTFAFVLT